MQIVFITHHNFLQLHALSPVVSWLIVIGGLYGAGRAFVSLGRALRHVWRSIMAEPKEPAETHQAVQG